MKKKKSQSFIIPLVLYPFDVLVSIGQTDQEFQRTLRRHLPPSCLKDLETDPVILNLGESNLARTVNFETGHQTAIRFKKHPTTTRDHGIIAHEAFHAAAFVLMRMSIPFEIGKTDEVYAYLLDYIVEKIYDRL